MIVCEVTCLHGSGLWEAGDGELVAATLDGLERAGLMKRAEAIQCAVHRIPQTYPFYDLEYRDRCDTLLEYLAGFPGLVSAGRQGLFLHNNMDHSIHMGFRAADALLAEPPEAAPRRFYAEVPRFRAFRIVD